MFVKGECYHCSGSLIYDRYIGKDGGIRCWKCGRVNYEYLPQKSEEKIQDKKVSEFKNKIKMTCCICGKEFMMPRFRLDMGQEFACSLKCSKERGVRYTRRKREEERMADAV